MANPDIHVDVLRVFTDEDGEHGNPLGVVDGAVVPAEDRQAVATELGYSETVFVDDTAAGRIQIFTPASELPFAGHPTVGTAWWLRSHGHLAERLQVPAGVVEVAHGGDTTRVRAHEGWTPDFQWHDVEGVGEVEGAEPTAYGPGLHYVWAWIDESAGRVRSRMFGPELGIPEDEATGAAAIRFTARLERDLDITQGRGSRLYTQWHGDGWASVGGRVVQDAGRVLPRPAK